MFVNHRHMYSASTVTASWLKRSNKTLMDNNALFSKLDKAMTKKSTLIVNSLVPAVDGNIGTRAFSTAMGNKFERAFSVGHDGVCLKNVFGKNQKRSLCNIGYDGISFELPKSARDDIIAAKSARLSIASAFVPEEPVKQEFENIATISSRAAYLHKRKEMIETAVAAQAKKTENKMIMSGYDCISFEGLDLKADLEKKAEISAEKADAAEKVEENAVPIFFQHNPVDEKATSIPSFDGTKDTNILNRQWVNYPGSPTRRPLRSAVSAHTP